MRKSQYSVKLYHVFCEIVPSKYIAVNGKNAVWMNENINSKIKTRNLLYKQDIQNGRLEGDFVLLETFITELDLF